MSFATDMLSVAVNLCTELGNSCVLTKNVAGAYDPATGETPQTATTINTFSAPVKKMSDIFPLNGSNTNLSGFDDNKVIIPYPGEEIDSTWLYNGNNVISVEPIMTQNQIIIYTISVGEKR